MHDALHRECGECGYRAQRRAVTGPWCLEEAERNNDGHERRKGPQRGFYREGVPYAGAPSECVGERCCALALPREGREG